MEVARIAEKKILSEFSKADFEVVSEDEESFIRFRGYGDLEAYKRRLEELKRDFHSEAESNLLSIPSESKAELYLNGVIGRFEAIKAYYVKEDGMIKHVAAKCAKSDFIKDGSGFELSDLAEVSKFLEIDMAFIESVVSDLQAIMKRAERKVLEWVGSPQEFVKAFSALIEQEKIKFGGSFAAAPIVEIFVDLFRVPKAKGEGYTNRDSLITYFKNELGSRFGAKGKKRT